MEAYRSYPDDRGYPESQSADPGYADGSGWYGERRAGDLPSPDPRPDPGAPDPSWHEPSRHEPSRPSPGPVDPPYRASPPPPEPAPAPRYEPGRGEPGRGMPSEPPPVPRRPPVAPGSPGPVGDGVYRSRRPAAAVLFGAPAAVLEVPALLLLLDAVSGDAVSASGIIAACCLIVALPLAAFGLYAVATGAVRAAGPNSAQAWLRPPVAYLSVALVLFLAAGLAA